MLLTHVRTGVGFHTTTTKAQPQPLPAGSESQSRASRAYSALAPKGRALISSLKTVLQARAQINFGRRER